MTKQSAPLRLLTAVPVCDGHDSAINTINLELVRAGAEVIYLGYHRPARDIVRSAIQEDVAAVGISSYNGGHVEFFAEVVAQLKRHGAGHIKVFGGGGGTISAADVKVMQKRGVDKIFPAGTSLDSMVEFTLSRYAKVKQPKSAKAGSDLALSMQLSRGMSANKSASAKSARFAPPVLGVAGPGGAGASTARGFFACGIDRAWPGAGAAAGGSASCGCTGTSAGTPARRHRRGLGRGKGGSC
ncbi:MAG TPA: cobalamin-dependent protein, partial [Tepidisphaeraceae bacterium]|nr:cobalamin-dependent protein [Tepidisphaeraceae bacterium]